MYIYVYIYIYIYIYQYKLLKYLADNSFVKTLSFGLQGDLRLTMAC